MGVAPLLNDKAGDVWCEGTLVSPFNAHVSWASVLCADNNTTRICTEACLDHLAMEQCCVRLAFPSVLAAGSLAQICRRSPAVGRCTAAVLDRSSSPLVHINGDWESHLKSQSRHTAKEARRKVKRFDGAGHAERVVIVSEDRVEQAMRDVLFIEERSWKEELGSSFTAGPGLTRFYGTFASQAAENGWLRLYLLYLDSRPVAHIYGVVLQNHYYALKTSYDMAYRQLSAASMC